MKSILLKTLAASSLVATTHAQIHVMGASFKERGVNAPTGTIVTNAGTVAATRGYFIMDTTMLTATPNAATYIEYGEIRGGGQINRFYTIDTDFDAFLADSISGGSGGRRIYGHMRAPVTISDVPNPMIPFSGTTYSSDFPRKISFDQTVFQSGASSTATGPQIVLLNSSTKRSVISGSANPVKVKATTVADATTELVARLVKQGYTKTVGEAPEITSTFPATLSLRDGEPHTFTVTLDPDVFPVGEDTFAGPTYQWYKDNAPIPTGIAPSLSITGGATSPTNGSGTYRVVVTNALGSATSTNVVVSAPANAFTTDLPGTLTIQGASSSVLSVVINPEPVTPPTYQWFKNNVAIPAVDGGADATLTVVGGAATTGAGTYRVEITNSTGPLVSANCVVTVNNVAMSFTTNLPATTQVPFGTTAVLAPVVIPNALPKVVTYQWARATASAGPFTNVATGDGGQGPTLTVTGNNANTTTGPGFYRLTIGNGTTTLTSATTQVSVTP